MRSKMALGAQSALLLTLLLTSCQSTLESGAYLCEPDQPGACPASWLCQCRGADCVWRCYDSNGGFCGDGVLDAGEECDGEAFSVDLSCPQGGYLLCQVDCRSTCTACGNGKLEAGANGQREECDDGNFISGDGCSATCQLARCGDGFVDTVLYEGCDEGASNSNAPNAGCRLDCQPQRCGDGIVDRGRGEVCDDGNASGSDGCTPDCLSTVICGNAYLDLLIGEQCDDGNLLSHDGCSSSCLVESPVRLLPSSSLPSPYLGQNRAAVAYDAARGRLVAFGGRYRSGEPSGATWEGDGVKWNGTGAIGPAAALDASMTYDSARQRVVLSTNGLWDWDGLRWKRLPIDASSPAPAALAAITYDSRRKRLLAFDGKLWEWTSVTKRWRDLAPSGVHPTPGNGELIYDPSTGHVILIHQRLWRWNDAQLRWEAQSLDLPFLHQDISVTYDARREKLLIFTHQGTWAWHGRTGTLAEDHAFPYDQEPSDARVGAQIAYHQGLRKTLLMGGFNEDQVFPFPNWNLDDGGWRSALPGETPLWPYIEVEDPRRSTTLRLGCGDNLQNWELRRGEWRSLPESATAIPCELHSLDVARDPKRDRLIALVTWTWDYSETWEWDGHTWYQVPTEPPISIVGFQQLRYDESLELLLLIHLSSQDAWAWDGTTWELIAEGVVGTFDPATIAFDRIRERTIAFATDSFSSYMTELVRKEDGSGYEWILSIPPFRTRTGQMSSHIWFNPERGRISSLDRNSSFWEWDGARWRAISQVFFPLSSVDATSPSALAEPGSTVKYINRSSPEETCRFGFDADKDGLSACEDPDCWRLCTPTCSPGQTCPIDAPRCGDGTCDPYFEDCRLCSSDCGACAPDCGEHLCDPGETAMSCPGDCP